MEKAKLKKEVEHLLKSLPDNAGWDDLMYKIYIRQSLDQGLKDVEAGHLVSHEGIKQKFQPPK